MSSNFSYCKLFVEHVLPWLWKGYLWELVGLREVWSQVLSWLPWLSPSLSEWSHSQSVCCMKEDGRRKQRNSTHPRIVTSSFTWKTYERITITIKAVPTPSTTWNKHALSDNAMRIVEDSSGPNGCKRIQVQVGLVLMCCITRQWRSVITVEVCELFVMSMEVMTNSVWKKQWTGDTLVEREWCLGVRERKK